MARKKQKTSIALEPALIARLDRVSRASGRSRSEVITELVEDGLGQAEMMIKATADPVLMAAVGKVMSDPGVLRNMVSGLRTELTDDQLSLFKSRLDSMTTDAMQKAATESVAKKSLGKKRKR